MILHPNAVCMRAMVCVVKLCRPVSHLEISDSRLFSNRAKSFCVSPFSFKISQMRSAMPKDNSNSAFCSAGMAARLSRNNLFCTMIQISNVALSMSIIIFFSMVMMPFFWALSRTLSKVCKSMTYPLNFSSSWYVRESFTPPFPKIRIWSDILKQYKRSFRESMDNALTRSLIFPSIRKKRSKAPLSIILDSANKMVLKSLLYVALSLNSKMIFQIHFPHFLQSRWKTFLRYRSALLF